MMLKRNNFSRNNIHKLYGTKPISSDIWTSELINAMLVTSSMWNVYRKPKLSTGLLQLFNL